VVINGDDAEVRMHQCKPGGNIGGSDPDLKMEFGGSLAYSSTAQVSAVYTNSEALLGESCSGTSDTNGNGLTGWEDPFCHVQMGHAYSSQNLENNLFVPDPACYSNGSYNYNDAVASTGVMDWSGCLRNTLRSFQNEDSVIEIYDDQQQSLVCAQSGLGQSDFVETEVDKGEEYWLAATFDEDSVSSFVLQGNVNYGYDCDGNCCYDVYMTDAYTVGGVEYGDGWNGAYLEVLQGGTLMDTITLPTGSSGWDSFCVDSGAGFSLNWNDSIQNYNDTETFVVMQGNDGSGTTMCSVSDPSTGLQSACGNSGVMTCQ
jgi:hypothetical protein